MLRIVIVWDPDSPGSITLNLNRTIEVDQFGDYPREDPLYSDLRLHYDPVERRWLTGKYPFLRLEGTLVRWPDGRVEDLKSQEMIKSLRANQGYYWISREGADDLARQNGKILPSDLSLSATEPKPARPRTLRELAALLWDEGPKSRNVPEFLKLIEERFAQSNPPASEVEIPFTDIIKRCHAGDDVEVDTIRKTTLDPAKRAILQAKLPYRLRVSWSREIVIVTRLSD
jgi:hypothetical protein